MSVPPPNRPGPYTYPDPAVTPPIDPADPLAPTLLDPVPRRRPVPLWIPIIAVGGLLAAAIFGIASLNNQNKTQEVTPVAAVTTTITPDTTNQVVAQVVTPTQTPIVIVVTATPLPQETPVAQPTAAPVQPQPTAIPAQPAPVTTVADPTATPRPAPTQPPVVVQPTATQPPAPTQPLPTPVPPTAVPPTAAPTATLPPAPTAQPTKVPVSPTPSQPAPTATLVPLNSQSIGLFRTEWEKWHGQPETRDNGLFYENGKYMVVFFEDRISRLERMFSNNPVAIDAARNESKGFLPQDAKMVGTTTGPDSMPVDLYKSEALKTYFAGVTDPDFWKGGEPGNFIVQYRKTDKDPNLVSAVVITLGNNPQKQP